MKSPIRVLISGGGTGGHVFPAIAIANALRKIDAAIQVHFIGAEGKLEMQKVPEAGYEIDGLWISGFQRDNMLKNALLPLKVISSLSKAFRIIRKFKPDVMVGVGGYASGPAMYVASKLGIPILIQEQNSFAGVTNKMVANKAARFCVAYDGMEKFFPKEKIVKTGNPVRANIAASDSDRMKSYEFFNLSPAKKTLLVIGGSLGARTINESIRGGIEELAKHDIQLIWQTGRTHFEQMKPAGQQPHVRIFDFIREMNFAYEAADVIISRAGAISISELCLIKKPVILVPSPNVAEDHQTKNALALSEKNAAWLVKDAEARQILVQRAIELIENTDAQKKISENIARLGSLNAAELIAKEILALVRHSER